MISHESSRARSHWSDRLRLLWSDTVWRLRLTSFRFEIEPEITLELLRLGGRMVEVPARYRLRTREEGKETGWGDAILAVRTRIAHRLADPRPFVRPTGR